MVGVHTPEFAFEIREQRLYQLIREPGPIVDRPFEFLDAGVEAFAFTFG